MEFLKSRRQVNLQQPGMHIIHQETSYSRRRILCDYKYVKSGVEVSIRNSVSHSSDRIQIISMHYIGSDPN